MKRQLIGIPLALVVAALSAAPADAQSPFDKLKSKAKKAIEKTVDEVVGDPANPTSAPATDKDKDGAGANNDGAAAATGADGTALDPDDPAPYGRWQGGMDARGKKSQIGYGGLDIVLSDTVDVLRYANAARRCLAELNGQDGAYEATFVTGQSFCGTTAKLRLSADGALRIEWLDAPNTAADERVYTGRLEQTRKSWPVKWSTSADQRAAFDVVGFALGMTYEAALAHMKAEHDDLQNELRMIVDAGSTSLVQHLEPKQVKGGDSVEEINLVFEAQTPEQMEVEQDPAVLARREEIKQMQQERSELIRKRREQRFDRRVRGEDVSNEPAPHDLPPLPEMPALRVPGADGELLAIQRTVKFPRKSRPHEANVLSALTGKYGQPSVRIDQGPIRKLQWVFDAGGKRLGDASEGPCDHIWKPPGRLEGLVDWYGRKAIYASVNPQCGLTIKVEMRYEDSDRGVYQLAMTVYDQQRLLGDEWVKIREFSAGYLAEEKAKLAATKQVEAPDL